MATTFADVKRAFNKWLEIPDPDVLDIVTGTVVANLYKENPVWVFLVAPPGSLKSEIISSLNDIDFSYPLSDLTPQSFVSGKGKGYSFLPKMDNHILTLKDFTTILSKRYESLSEILSQLREIYDGQYSKIFGTGEEVSWSGHIGLLSGCTEVIDIKRDIHSILGERFVLYRLPVGDRAKVGARALENVNKVNVMRGELREVMRDFFETYLNKSPKRPTIGVAYRRRLVALADITAHGRVAVPRERSTNMIIQVLSPESPARLVQIFGLLAQAIAAVNGRKAVGPKEMKIIAKIAADTMIKSRRQLMEIMWRKRREKTSTADMAEEVSVPTSTVGRHLEDMWVLHCIKRELEGSDKVSIGDKKLSVGRKKYLWWLNGEWEKKLELTKIFGPAHE